MGKRNRIELSAPPVVANIGCCKVRALASVDERGQMVLPKEIRDGLQLHPGDKLALVSWEKGEKICCVSLIRVEELAELVQGVLGPVLGGILPKENVKARRTLKWKTKK